MSVAPVLENCFPPLHRLIAKPHHELESGRPTAPTSTQEVKPEQEKLVLAGNHQDDGRETINAGDKGRLFAESQNVVALV